MLPKLDQPTFDVELPSTQKQIQLRPFLIKEEKILLTAYEGQKDAENKVRKMADPESNAAIEILSAAEDKSLDAMRSVIQNCIQTPGIKIEDLTSFDIDWLIVKIREKSVGETVELKMRNGVNGNKCGLESPCKDMMDDVVINLPDAQLIKNEKHTNKINVRGDVGVVMRYPTGKNLKKLNSQKNNSGAIEVLYDIIIACIESIYDANDIYKAEDVSPQELKDFIYQFRSDEFSKIVTSFFDTMPFVELKVSYSCSKCGQVQNHDIKGFENFLALS